MIYKLYFAQGEKNIPNAAMTINTAPQISFVFDPANTDYQNFKKQINADEAQLEDAEGTLMTAEQAKAFVATLP